eukprot:2961542-Rhodomonas_salina.1
MELLSERYQPMLSLVPATRGGVGAYVVLRGSVLRGRRKESLGEGASQTVLITCAPQRPGTRISFVSTGSRSTNARTVQIVVLANLTAWYKEEYEGGKATVIQVQYVCSGRNVALFVCDGYSPPPTSSRRLDVEVVTTPAVLREKPGSNPSKVSTGHCVAQYRTFRSNGMSAAYGYAAVDPRLMAVRPLIPGSWLYGR